MAGGDATRRHNGLRDQTYEHARMGGMQPSREPSHLLARPSGCTEPCLRRPADVLIPRWPERSSHGAAGSDMAALDFAVINALAPTHVDRTQNESGTAAATAYAQSKRVFEGTAARCAQQGITLRPIVFTAQGAADPNALRTLEVVHRAVASATGSALPRVRSSFSERISMNILKANARAARRRDPNGAIAAQRGPNAVSKQARQALGNLIGPQNVADEAEEVDGGGAATGRCLSAAALASSAG